MFNTTVIQDKYVHLLDISQESSMWLSSGNFSHKFYLDSPFIHLSADMLICKVTTTNC